MDPPAIIGSDPSQQAMFAVQKTPICYSLFPQNNSTLIQDTLSFSSNQPSQKTLEDDHDNAEISIFDAQKYFNESGELPKGIGFHRDSAEEILSVSYGSRNFIRTRSFRAAGETPTASSEASWNSHTGLLVNPPGSVRVSMANQTSEDRRKRNPKAGKKWGFGRNCCCTGKKSVQVKETPSHSDHLGPVIVNNGGFDINFHRTKPDPPGVPERLNDILEIHGHKVGAPNPLQMSPENRFPSGDQPRQRRVSASGRMFVDGAGGFSFPILNPNSQSANSTVSKGVIGKFPIINPLEDPPRDSLEVFQPPVETSGNDDMCSDASSDLFEIESFSTQTTSFPTYRRRDSMDEAPPPPPTFSSRRFAAANGLIDFGGRSLDETPTPSVAATECYAPSEVSVDWSVTTAEGFDRASVSNFSASASEVGGAAAFQRQRVQKEPWGGQKKGIGGGGLLLMSCRQEKAVSVGPSPVKCAEPAAEGVHVSGRAPPRANKLLVGSSHAAAARLSLAFAA